MLWPEWMQKLDHVLTGTIVCNLLRDIPLYRYIPRLRPSTAGCSPPHHVSSRLTVRHICPKGLLSSARCRLAISSSVYLVIFCHFGCQSVILFVESCYMTCPFPFLLGCEFDYVFNICFALISRHGILSFNFAFNIFLSIARCAVLCLWVVALVNDHVWHP